MKTALVLQEGLTSGQVNAIWQNVNKYIADTAAICMYNKVTKEVNSKLVTLAVSM